MSAQLCGWPATGIPPGEGIQLRRRGKWGLANYHGYCFSERNHRPLSCGSNQNDEADQAVFTFRRTARRVPGPPEFGQAPRAYHRQYLALPVLALSKIEYFRLQTGRVGHTSYERNRELRSRSLRFHHSTTDLHLALITNPSALVVCW